MEDLDEEELNRKLAELRRTTSVIDWDIRLNQKILKSLDKESPSESIDKKKEMLKDDIKEMRQLFRDISKDEKTLKTYLERKSIISVNKR